MTNEVEISDVKTSDDSDLRSFKVKLAKNYIQTPVKAVTTNNFFKDTSFPDKLSNLSEHFIRFDENNLQTYFTVKKETDKKSNTYNKHKTKLNPDATSITIVEYKNKEPKNEENMTLPKIPDEKEIKSLINAAYSLSDITAIPSLPIVARNIDFKTFPDFISYIKSCHDKIQIRNKKKILGYIPLVAPAFLELIVEFYLKELGINAFYVDFDGTTLNTNKPGIDAIKRKIHEEGYEENHFIHYVNITYGKAINDIGVLTARDLLAYGHGLDSLGGTHVPPKRGKNFYEWLKKQKDIESNTTRILNIDDYGYYKYGVEGVKVEDFYPKDPLTKIVDIEDKPSFSTKKRFFDIENLHQQVSETVNLRRLVKEESNKTIDYFKHKKSVTSEDIKLLKE